MTTNCSYHDIKWLWCWRRQQLLVCYHHHHVLSSSSSSSYCVIIINCVIISWKLSWAPPPSRPCAVVHFPRPQLEIYVWWGKGGIVEMSVMSFFGKVGWQSHRHCQTCRHSKSERPCDRSHRQVFEIFRQNLGWERKSINFALRAMPCKADIAILP